MKLCRKYIFAFFFGVAFICLKNNFIKNMFCSKYKYDPHQNGQQNQGKNGFAFKFRFLVPIHKLDSQNKKSVHAWQHEINLYFIDTGHHLYQFIFGPFKWKRQCYACWYELHDSLVAKMVGRWNIFKIQANCSRLWLTGRKSKGLLSFANTLWEKKKLRTCERKITMWSKRKMYGFTFIRV